MRTGAASGHHGYYHEAFVYRSDDELADVVVPFLDGGREAGEPTIAILGERAAAVVRGELGDTEGIDVVVGDEQYGRPAATIRAWQAIFDRHVASGATQIRAVGEMPARAMGAGWEAWARYEAALNVAYRDIPLWGICSYDARSASPAVLDDVARTHPHVAGPDGSHAHNARYEDPADFLASRSPAPADPLQRGAPAIDLTGPSPAEARHAVAALSASLDPTSAADLVTAVSEVVTNAIRHGVPPVRLQAWRGDGRVVVAVQDEGTGPADPFVGLLPPDREPGQGGLGLWISHQVCHDVTMWRGDGGFTVRLTAGLGTGDAGGEDLAV
jgi:anti-sigma regulatory factor (Ser/Thr protein kinase)